MEISTSPAWGIGLATVTAEGQVLDTWYPTPALGEASGFPDVTQSDVAATMLQYLGLDWRAFNAQAGPPIPRSLKAE